MKLHDLRVLMAVVQAGSMNKAAALLNTTQPSISRSIAELESILGVRVLDRNTQGVEATAYGRALVDGGAAIFDELHQAVKCIEFLAHPAAGDVRIGCNPFFAGTFVSAVIERLLRHYPRMAFHLTTETDSLYRELIDRHVDFLIARRLSAFTGDKFSFEMLYDDSYVVVTGSQSPWARRRKISLADLANEPWLLPPPDRALGPAFLEAFRASGLEYPRATVSVAPPDVRMGLLARMHFLTIIPMSVLTFSAKRTEIKVLPIKLQHARAPIGIVTLKSRTLSPVAKLFIEHAREVAKPLAKKNTRGHVG